MILAKDDRKKRTHGSRGAYAPPLTPYVKGGVIGELRSPTL